MELHDADVLREKLQMQNVFAEPLYAQLRAYYRVALTWSSTALDGNALTELETKVVLEDGLTVSGRPLRDLFETVGHGRACDNMFSLVDKQTMTEADILTLHRSLRRGMDRGPAGQYRTVRVCYSGSRYPTAAPEAIPTEMGKLLRWMEDVRAGLHPIIFAARLHTRLLFIAPFQSGNGQAARLLMNTALLQRGYPPAVIPPALRQEYMGLLEQARQDDGPLTDFIARRVTETQVQLLEYLDGPSPERGPGIVLG